MTAQFSTITEEEAMELIEATGGDFPTLLNRASALTDAHKGNVVTYAKKVFFSLIHHLNDNYMCCQEDRFTHEQGLCILTRREIMKLAQYGKKAGCKEALFTTEPLTKEEQALVNNWLADMGYRSFADYLAAMCRLVFDEFQLIPHPNTYGMTADDMAVVRPYSGSLTITLRLAEGDLERNHSMERLQFAGEQNAPVTVVLPIGRGETVEDRVRALFELADLQAKFKHIQEVVVQNSYLEVSREALLDIVRAAAVTRLVMGGDMNLQARSVMTPEAYELCMMAGVNDWGGVIVNNPDLPNVDWTQYESLSEQTRNVGLRLRERNAIHENIFEERPELIAPQIYEHIQQLMIDTEGDNITSLDA